MNRHRAVLSIASALFASENQARVIVLQLYDRTIGLLMEILQRGRMKNDLAKDVDVLAITKYGGMTQAEAESSMRLFADEVSPRLRATSRAAA